MLLPSRNTVYVTRLTPGLAIGAFTKTLDLYAPLLPSACRRIAIKVNLCDYRMASSGATTDPALVASLIDALRARFSAAEISIVENNASSVEAWTLFALLGFDDLAAAKRVRLVNVAEDHWTSVELPCGRVLKRMEIPQTITEADLFIDFAKLKTNALTKTTGCLKNLFGLLRCKQKSVYHPRIHDILVDINSVIRPHLCLIDGYIGMEGWGPAFGIPKRCELLIAGVDPVSTDACAARIMGFSPWFVRYIRLCARARIGSLRYRLHTDIEGFRYAPYRFQYSRIEHIARAVLRRRLGVAA